MRNQIECKCWATRIRNRWILLSLVNKLLDGIPKWMVVFTAYIDLIFLSCFVEFLLLFSKSSVWFISQLLGNLCIFLCANITGVFTKYPTEISQRRAFLETRRCIESRLTIMKENQNQVLKLITRLSIDNSEWVFI